LSEGDSANSQPEKMVRAGAAGCPCRAGGCSASCTKAADCVRSTGLVRSQLLNTPESRPKRKPSPGFSVKVSVVPSRLSSAISTAVRSEGGVGEGAVRAGAAGAGLAGLASCAASGAATASAANAARTAAFIRRRRPALQPALPRLPVRSRRCD
jgi:hypothetical protein